MAKATTTVAAFIMFGLACTMVAILASGRVSMAGDIATGRKLLAATDDRFNYYEQNCPGKNVMVCDSCTATNLQGVTVSGEDGGFQIWCMDSGTIVRQGDGGYDHWQFSGCFTRGGSQGQIVTFTHC